MGRESRAIAYSHDPTTLTIPGRKGKKRFLRISLGVAKCRGWPCACPLRATTRVALTDGVNPLNSRRPPKTNLGRFSRALAREKRPLKSSPPWGWGKSKHAITRGENRCGRSPDRAPASPKISHRPSVVGFSLIFMLNQNNRAAANGIQRRIPGGIQIGGGR